MQPPYYKTQRLTGAAGLHLSKLQFKKEHSTLRFFYRSKRGWVPMHQTKYIFISGGVVSSLGKGLTAASIAMLLEARGLRVAMLKLDPYLNVDP